MARALDDLVALGIVHRTIGGRDHLVRLNPEHRLHAPLTALIARESELFLELRQRLAAIATGTARRARLVSVALFGSVARAQDRVDSDCDVLVVARDAAGLDVAMTTLEQAADSLHRAYGCVVRPVGYVQRDAARKFRARAAPFPDIARDGLVVYGPPLAEALRGNA
jgi:predicted nucleotidyltransferase